MMKMQSQSNFFCTTNWFCIGMANVIASYEGENVGFVADLVFGPRGADAILILLWILVQVVLLINFTCIGMFLTKLL